MLESIRSPRDLRKLTNAQLDRLAAEIREFLVCHVSQTGGHLASNLGVVELTLALHKYLDCPRDKIIWDVGHQSYVHKIITGRKNGFAKLRQRGGMSGFPRRSESRYDEFGAGHASTSISAAMGIAEAYAKQKKKVRVAAVIGDGAMTGGLALEAINQIGYLQSNVMIVLNDNRMSISENVGALSLYTKRIENTETYQQVRNEINGLLGETRGDRDRYARLKSLKKALKEVGTPGLLFEKLGINYFGPVDGHSFAELQKAFAFASEAQGPILIHVRTRKGLGYEPAECAADKFHGVSPFSVETGKAVSCSNGVSYSQAFGETMVKLAERNKKIVAITAAMPSGTGLADFANRFPEQFYDVGICEEHAVTFAAGLAASGLRPVVAVYSTFLQRAYDQVIHDVCLQNLPVVFAIDRAGLVGEDGPTHHGVFDLSYLRHIPNLTILAPKDTTELSAMLRYALNQKGPIAIRYPRGCDERNLITQKLDLLRRQSGVRIVLKKPRSSICSKAEVLCEPANLSFSSHRQDSVVLVAVGSQVLRSIEYALRKKISATIINARSVKPIDNTVFAAIKKAGKVVVFEDNAKAGGFGSAILEGLAQRKIDADIRLVGIRDAFVEHGDVEHLKRLYIK